VTVEAWGEKFAPLQPNIFPKFLFHFADFPYKLCIHQPEPAQLGNLLRIAVRTGRKSIHYQTPTLGFSRDKRVDFSSQLQPEGFKKTKPLFGPVIVHLGSIPFRKPPMLLKENRKLSPVSLQSSPRVRHCFFVAVSNHAAGGQISMAFFFGVVERNVTRRSLSTSVFLTPLNFRLTPIVSNFTGNPFPLRSSKLR